VGRYKGPVDKIITLANRAGVVIYVLDTEGVVMEAATPKEALAQDSERLLAEKTGGRRILSTVGFDLTTSFNEVIEDLSGYYLLGYRPAGDDSPLKTPIRHKIEVKVLRAGLKGHDAITEQRLRVLFEANPDLIRPWFILSGDQRTKYGYYLLPPGVSPNRSRDLVVGYYPGGKEEHFPDGATACARFVKLEAENLRYMIEGDPPFQPRR